jgi:hypothetical protein
MTTAKYMKKLEIQSKKNPGHKTKYEPKPSRNFVILNNKDKHNSRQSRKAETRRLVCEW